MCQCAWFRNLENDARVAIAYFDGTAAEEERRRGCSPCWLATTLVQFRAMCFTFWGVLLVLRHESWLVRVGTVRFGQPPMVRIAHHAQFKQHSMIPSDRRQRVRGWLSTSGCHVFNLQSRLDICGACETVSWMFRADLSNPRTKAMMQLLGPEIPGESMSLLLLVEGWFGLMSCLASLRCQRDECAELVSCRRYRGVSRTGGASPWSEGYNRSPQPFSTHDPSVLHIAPNSIN